MEKNGVKLLLLFLRFVRGGGGGGRDKGGIEVWFKICGGRVDRGEGRKQRVGGWQEKSPILFYIPLGPLHFLTHGLRPVLLCSAAHSSY